MELVSVAIRRARPADAGGIARVEAESWCDTYPTLIPHEHLARKLDARSRARMWRQRIAGQATGGVWVAVAGAAGGVAGYATCGPCRHGTLPFDGEIFELYLVPDCQGQGLGRRLLLAVSRHFLGLGMSSMCVEVLEGNVNRFFYAAMGASLAARGRHPFAGIELPTLIYGWRDLSGLPAHGG